MTTQPKIRYHVVYSIGGRERIATLDEETLVNSIRDLFASHGPSSSDAARLDYINIIPLQSDR